MCTQSGSLAISVAFREHERDVTRAQVKALRAAHPTGHPGGIATEGLPGLSRVHSQLVHSAASQK